MEHPFALAILAFAFAYIAYSIVYTMITGAEFLPKRNDVEND